MAINTEALKAYIEPVKTGFNEAAKVVSAGINKGVQGAYVINRQADDILKMKDVFLKTSNEKKLKYLEKIKEKALSDWPKVQQNHKILDFISKHSDKIAKGGIIAAGLAAFAAHIALFNHVVNAAQQKAEVRNSTKA